MCFVPQLRALFWHLDVQEWSGRAVFLAYWLRTAPQRCALFLSSQLPKVLELRCVLGMCFAPEWCALFRHLSFQNWSGRVVLLTFWLPSVLRATKACTCWLGRVLRATMVCNCSSHLASWLRTSWLRTRRFSDGATNHWKNTMFCDFPTFSRTCIFFFFSSLLWLFLLTFLPGSSHLCFSSVHIVGSLTSKLPSMMVLNRVSSFALQFSRGVFVAESICSPALHAVNVHTCAFHKHLKDSKH